MVDIQIFRIFLTSFLLTPLLVSTFYEMLSQLCGLASVSPRKHIAFSPVELGKCLCFHI